VTEGHFRGKKTPHSFKVLNNLKAFLLYDTLTVLGYSEKELFKTATSKTGERKTELPQQVSEYLQNIALTPTYTNYQFAKHKVIAKELTKAVATFA
jgi:hypothetical protein